MSISVIGVARVGSQAPQAPPASDTGGAGAGNERVGAESYSAVEIDAATNQPKPPRFPWLSRLSSELEPAAKQKPTFQSAPPLGENLDQAV